MEFNPKWQTQSPHEAGITPKCCPQGETFPATANIAVGMSAQFSAFSSEVMYLEFLCGIS